MTALDSRRPALDLPRPVWHLAVESFLPPRVRPFTDATISRLPILVVLLVQALVSLRLTNTAFEDEGLYIDAGHAYVADLLHGTPPPEQYGTFFSGVPVLYPVFAAMLDGVGGLQLVRAFSLLCMMVSTLCLYSVTSHLWGRRAGLFGALFFVLTAPVQFLGAFATFDAPCLACLTIALWLGVVRRSHALSVVIGMLLALAVALKYTGAVFVPIVLVIIALSGPFRCQFCRATVAGVICAAILAAGYLGGGQSLQRGIRFTTSNRKALSPATIPHLLHFLAQDDGPILVLALVGAAVLISKAMSHGPLVMAFLCGAAVLPASQLRIGEAVSFEKHLGYSALFLAPLAGAGLAAMTKKVIGLALVGVMLYVGTSEGLSRSQDMYYWPNVSQVIKLIERNPAPGKYLSSSSRPLAYYTRTRDPGIVFSDEYGLFSSGVAAMRQAVTGRTYQMLIFSTGSSGNKVADDRTATFLSIVEKSPNYILDATPFPVRKYSVDRWLMYRLVDTARR